MAKPNNRVKKAFALSYILRALFLSFKNGNPKITSLHVKVNDAMSVFKTKATRDFFVITSDISDLWVEMAKEHDNKLDEDEYEVFVEMVLSLLPRADMKKFLGMTFSTKHTLHDSKKSALLVAVLDLDEKLNKMFGTDPTATRESLGRIMVKPIKIKAVKKERDKAIPHRTKKLRKRLEWHKKRRLAV